LAELPDAGGGDPREAGRPGMEVTP